MILGLDRIKLARANLVRARCLRQKSQFTRDMALKYYSGNDQIAMFQYGKAQSEHAKRAREIARDALRQEEYLAGRAYAMGVAGNYGAKNLDGKNFKSWAEYSVEYGKHGDVDTWGPRE